MTKCVKEYDVVLGEDEVAVVESLYHSLIKNYARDHFSNNEGWTQEEVDENLEVGNPEIGLAFYQQEDGTLAHEVVSIRVPVTVIRSKTDEDTSPDSD